MIKKSIDELAEDMLIGLIKTETKNYPILVNEQMQLIDVSLVKNKALIDKMQSMLQFDFSHAYTATLSTSEVIIGYKHNADFYFDKNDEIITFDVELPITTVADNITIRLSKSQFLSHIKPFRFPDFHPGMENDKYYVVFELSPRKTLVLFFLNPKINSETLFKQFTEKVFILVS